MKNSILYLFISFNFDAHLILIYRTVANTRKSKLTALLIIFLIFPCNFLYCNNGQENKFITNFSVPFYSPSPIRFLSPPRQKTSPQTVSTEGFNGSENVGFSEDNVALLHEPFPIPRTQRETPIQRSLFWPLQQTLFHESKPKNSKIAA